MIKRQRDDKKLVTIKGQVRGETEKAYRIFNGRVTEWVPKQFVEADNDTEFTMPEWLAYEKGFL